ncbi:L,D-transpeptidase [Nocardioides montaniterrae]
MTTGKRALRPEAGNRVEAPRSSAGRHRAVKPRYGRIILATVAAVVTVIAVVGGFGLHAQGHPGSAAAAANHALNPVTSKPTASTTTTAPAAPSTSAPATRQAPRTTASKASKPGPLPPNSGSGRRIVFSQGEQTVWLVNHNGAVRRSYFVSGSVTDNLQPGTFQVYSRSRWAVGVDDSGTMQYFVRFTHGPTGAAIGFHTIPQKGGQPLQTKAQLGTPQSHGCIRQDTVDAIDLWKFAPIGTTVVVVA